MKLSELKGERAVEVIADLIAPIANIASDQKSLQLFRNTRHEGESDEDFGKREITEKFPALLRTHKGDVLEILRAMTGSEPKDLSVVDIIKGVIELANDKDFVSLFLSAVNEGDKTQPTESSADAVISEPES